jgi:hypothetical protein
MHPAQPPTPGDGSGTYRSAHARGRRHEAGQERPVGYGSPTAADPLVIARTARGGLRGGRDQQDRDMNRTHAAYVPILPIMALASRVLRS